MCNLVDGRVILVAEITTLAAFSLPLFDLWIFGGPMGDLCECIVGDGSLIFCFLSFQVSELA